MLKQIKLGLLAMMVLAMMTSCQNSNNAVREEARQAVENGGVQPADQSAVQPAAQTAEAPSGPTTEMTFEETEFDFGTITEGEQVSHTYMFTNTGEEPLILSNTKASCGCTVPKWPREPIAPGASSEIVVEFNSNNKRGKKNQKVTITANTNPPQTFIYLKGEVLPKEDNNVQVTQ
jgi:hypothetical protein